MEADCGCFGRERSAPAGGRTLARNGVLAGVAAAVAVAGPGLAPAEALSGAEVPVWAIALALVLVAQAFFGWQLFRQHGRLLERVESLEAALAEPPAEPVPLRPAHEKLRGGGRLMAKRKEVRAVRKVLYNRKRMRKTFFELQQIDLLMNLDDNQPFIAKATSGCAPAPARSGSTRAARSIAGSSTQPPAARWSPSCCARRERSSRTSSSTRRTRRTSATPSPRRRTRGAPAAGSGPRPCGPRATATLAEIEVHERAAYQSYEKVQPYLDQDAVQDFA